MPTLEERLEERRSRVRRWTSYAAVAFLFGGGAGIIGYILWEFRDIDKAIDLFMMIVPIASGIIGYWFAEQKRTTKEKQPESDNEQ